MNRRSISFVKEEKYYSKGKWYLIFDYIFFIYIFFRIGIIHSIFLFETPKFGMKITDQLSYQLVIPIFTFLMWVIIFCIRIQSTPLFKEKITDWKTTRVRSLTTFSIPITIAFLFSMLFYDSIEALIFRFPEEYQDSIITSYYVSYIYTLIYSIIRSLLAFDYYKSFYLKLNRDYLSHFLIMYFIILTIVTAFLPSEWLYMFF